jgi:hypothetical protein
MFAGHIGAALALGRADRRVNLGLVVFAALLLDIALWLFVLLGWESVAIPAGFATEHQLEFAFPYTHGLLAATTWSAVAGAAALLGHRRLRTSKWRAAAVLALAVFSHWLLDAMVHVADLPLIGEQSSKLGLGLWKNLPAALAVESLITVAGLGLFLSGAGLSRGRTLGLSALTLGILALTVTGMTSAAPPPPVAVLAASSLATNILACMLAGWIGKRAE